MELSKLVDDMYERSDKAVFDVLHRLANLCVTQALVDVHEVASGDCSTVHSIQTTVVHLGDIDHTSTNTLDIYDVS